MLSLLDTQYSEDENKKEFETRDVNHNGQLEKVRLNTDVTKFGYDQHDCCSCLLRRVYKIQFFWIQFFKIGLFEHL